MRALATGCIAAITVAASVLVPSPVGAAEAGLPQRYIVVLNDDAGAPGAVAEEHRRGQGAQVQHLYRHALRGYSAQMSPAAAERIARDPRVDYVEPDRVVSIAHHKPGHGNSPSEPASPEPTQELPTGVDRIDVDQNGLAAIDGVRGDVDVDIAIIDTGIDEDHPDLNVDPNRGWNCVSFWFPGTCVEGLFEDGHGHGTHVAGTAAAYDNDFGVVGVAPGARLWAVGVLDDNGSGYWSWIIAGIDMVAANADQIEVANMSLGGAGYSEAARTAIANAVDKGVVFVVAAGNSNADVYGADGTLGTSDDYVPAAFPEAAAVSALADSDGAPGGGGSNTSYGPDDSFASFSNFSRTVVSGNPVNSPGKAIDLLMPGVDIHSTHRYGGYATYSGTSMASPHAAGLAGLYIAANGRATNASGVAAIRQALVDNGVPQTSSDGLSTHNDPDTNPENIGWAGISTTPTDPSNSVPVADDTDATGDEDTSIAWTPSVSDADSGDTLTCTIASQPAHGSASVASNCGTGSYTPAANWNGVDSFTYAVADGRGGSDSANVTITVSAVNDAPVAVDDSTATAVETPVTVDVLANDDDVDGDTVTLTGVTVDPSDGTTTVNGDGTITYAPNAAFTGTDTFTYAVSDGNGGTSSAAVTVEVRNQATSVLVSEVAQWGQGGKDGKMHLYIDVFVVDDLGNPVSGALVDIVLNDEGVPVATGTDGVTDGSGKAQFRLAKARSGCYTTTVTDVEVAGTPWDGQTPFHEPWCKV